MQFILNKKYSLKCQNNISIYYTLYLIYTKGRYNKRPETSDKKAAMQRSVFLNILNPQSTSSSSASLSQHSLPLMCFCGTRAVSSLTTNCATRQVHSKRRPRRFLKTASCVAVAGQGLVSPSAWLGGGSTRSLNPSFSRGSLVISWLENTREQREVSGSDEKQRELTPVNRFRDSVLYD